MSEWLKFDPVQTAIVVIAFIGAWFTLKRDSGWHSEWIKKHSEECDHRDERIGAVLAALQTSNAHLGTLTESHHERIGRIESQMDRART